MERWPGKAGGETSGVAGEGPKRRTGGYREAVTGPAGPFLPRRPGWHFFAFSEVSRRSVASSGQSGGSGFRWLPVGSCRNLFGSWGLGGSPAGLRVGGCDGSCAHIYMDRGGWESLGASRRDELGARGRRGSYELVAISGQWPVVRGQWSVVSEVV